MSRKLFWGIIASFLCLNTAYAGKSIVVDLSTQTATAYENGVPVFSGQVSTGTAKRPTPTGSFRVLEKDVDHVSSSWPKPNGGAKMHYMLRVTGYGIAMHLGFVPNYPASHGCIRMQNGFAQRMYNWAHVGVPIRIVGHAPARVYRSIARKSTAKKRKVSKKLTALEAFSSLPQNPAAHTVPAKTALKSTIKTSVPKVRSSKAVPSRASSTLDMLSTSPKAVERVQRTQKVKWKNRPKRKAPKVDPLKALRA